jgi:hypothetical protein
MKTKHAKFVALLGSLLALTTSSFAAAAAGAASERPALPSAAAGGMSSAAAGIDRAPLPAAGEGPAAAELNRARMADIPSAGLNANATAHASAQGHLNGLTIAAAASGGLSASLAPDDSVQAIRNAKFAERAQVAADLETRLAASEKLVAELDVDARSADNKSRAELAKSLTAVRKQQKEVRASLKATAQASDENWGKIQSQLAKDYGDLAQVVAEVEVAAKAAVTAQNAAKK